MTPAIQPRHRRPSWRQSRISHRTYLETDFSRNQNPDIPADGDTFCYNPAFIAEWTMPADLWVRLPASLTTEIRDWQAAGASVCTALARIDKMDTESLHRGWPSKSNAHLSRTTSDSSVLESLQSPNPCSPEVMPALTSVGLLPLQTSFDDRPQRDSTSLPHTDTPPFTPQDSIMGDEFDLSSQSIHEKISLDHVNSLLATKVRRASEHATSTTMPSPSMTPSSCRVSTTSPDPAQSVFDEAAWDVFIRSYEAELEHLRTETLVRFRHMGKSVDRLWLDLRNDSTQPMLDGATVEFVIWWQKMSDKAQEYDKEVQMLEPPLLDLVRTKRSSQGLPI